MSRKDRLAVLLRKATIAQRLARCMEKGALSVADLSTFCCVAYPTMRAWVSGREPRLARRRVLEAALSKLEMAIEKGTGLPVPFEMSQHRRPAYMGELRARILPEHPATRKPRASLRDNL
jgi:hypothetical protein